MGRKLVVLLFALYAASAGMADDACKPCEVVDLAKKTVKSLISCALNEISGFAGVGAKRYVSPGDWMDYTIYFENKSDATAAGTRDACPYRGTDGMVRSRVPRDRDREAA